MSALEIVQVISAIGAILTGFLLPIILSRMSAAKEAALAANRAASEAQEAAKKSAVVTEATAATTRVISDRTDGNLSRLNNQVQELQSLVLRLAEQNTTVGRGTADTLNIESIKEERKKDMKG